MRLSEDNLDLDMSSDENLSQILVDAIKDTNELWIHHTRERVQAFLPAPLGPVLDNSRNKKKEAG